MAEQVRLLQERYRDEPWKMLVCCILLNQTSRKQVDGVIDELFERWSDADAMSGADWKELADVIRPLGFQNRRALTLIAFSGEWDSKGYDERPPFSVTHLSGCGKYADDSYQIFFLGGEDFPVLSGDKELLAYVERRTHETSA